MLDINTDNFYSKKILSISSASELIRDLKSEGKKVGLCHGGFDLLHPGHVKHFESSKKFCDALFVSITSDKFIELRKGMGSGRPVYPDKLRAYMAAGIEFVDYVVISDYNTGVEIINLLKPDYYIKGRDYINSPDYELAAEKKTIDSVGGEIRFTTDPKLSTSDILRYIKNG